MKRFIPIIIFVVGVFCLIGFIAKDQIEQENGRLYEIYQAYQNSQQRKNILSDASIPAEYKAAYKKAEIYANELYLSKRGVYDQLTSEFDKFPPEAAQYAIDNIKADYNANALEKAKFYQSEMSMSTAAIKDQLTSEYGEKFTVSEASYAISLLE